MIYIFVKFETFKYFESARRRTNYIYFTVTVTDNYKRIKDTKRKTKLREPVYDVSGLSNNQNDDRYKHCFCK